MAEANANPAQAPGGQPTSDTTALTKTVTELQAELADMRKNQKILADTLAAQPPVESTKTEKQSAKGDAKAEPLTLEQINKVLDARETAKAQADARKQLVDRVVKEKLGGDAELAAFLPASGTEAEIVAAAEKLAARVRPANIGGANRDGGTPPARLPADILKLTPTERIAYGMRQRNAGAAR